VIFCLKWLGISEDLNRRIDENTRFCKAIKEQIEALEIQAAEARQTDPVNHLFIKRC